jgi:hypothetical protein
MAGRASGSYTVPGAKPAPTAVQSAYTNAGTAVRKQAGDYDDIMGKYRDIYASIPSQGSTGGAHLTQNYTIPTYQTTADYTRAIGNARNTADRGLYSDEDQANIRERGISPIRSVYANAQRNVNRQRSLQGGYSPNYAAVSAKMAREMSSQLSDATTRVNAQLAQDIASQRANAQSEYLGASKGEQGERNQFALNAAEMGNRYGLADVERQQRDYWKPTEMKLSAASGMNNTYGTTPAFANMMQNDAARTAGIQSNTNQANTNNQLRIAQVYGGGR